MALYVQTNVSSLNSQRRLNTATKSLDTTYQRLSSGLRINSAKDDAAGLQISNRLTNQINGLQQGNRNANDGIALCQTMEGALDETTSMLQRIRTLAIQAANGTNTTVDRIAIQQEISQLSAEITRIACKTTFAGRQCLAGVNGSDHGGVLDSKGKISFQVGAYAFDTLGVS
ncbi:MAG: flagellin, partial [Succinivibrio sp.]